MLISTPLILLPKGITFTKGYGMLELANDCKVHEKMALVKTSLLSLLQRHHNRTPTLRRVLHFVALLPAMGN